MANVRTSTTASKKPAAAKAAKKAPKKAAASTAAKPKKAITAPASPTPRKAPIRRTRAQVDTESPVTAEERQKMIAVAAYLRAESRGFVGGDPNDDWLTAEAEIDQILSRT